jgi:methylated-DNA-[protein]-cysteine S-methyltransferase
MQDDTREKAITVPEADYVFSFESPIGPIHVRSNDTCITAVEFRQSPAERIQANSPLEQQALDELQEFFDGKRTEFTFPFEQPGTEFQKRVWDELTRIPFGKTISYHELAVRLGDPKCIRAAGTANGRNNLAIVVPCHRVIGSDGSLTGYAGGLDKKEWLLRLEGSLPGMNQTSLF